MKVLHIDSRVVLPYANAGAWTFATPHDHVDLGRLAVVADDGFASPRLLAWAELGHTANSPPSGSAVELVEHLAAVLLAELGWLQPIPVGAEVRISARGSMRSRVSAEHLDYHRADTADWAKKQRRTGYLPVLVVRGDRVRVLALPWRGRGRLADLDEVRRLLPQYGVPKHDHLEVL